MRRMNSSEKVLNEPIQIEKVGIELPNGEYRLEWVSGKYSIIPYEQDWEITADYPESLSISEIADEYVESGYEEILDPSAEDFRKIWQELKTSKDKPEGQIWKNRKIE